VNPDELQKIADRIVAMAAPGEQVEAVVAWSRDTEVRAFEGEVEHFVSADSAGVGIRMISEGKQGLSWAGVLDDAALLECLAEARDNASFGSVDPHAGLAEPDGVEPEELFLFDERLVHADTEEKIRLAVELEAQVRAGDPRIFGIESADYADSVMATALATTTGIRRSSAETSVYLGVYALAGDDEDTTTGFGFSVGRALQDLDLASAAHEAVQRCIRLLGATKAPSERLTVVLHPYVTSQFLSLIADMLSGESVIRGRSPFAGRVGDSIAAPSFTMFDDATDPLSPTASDADGEGLACRAVPLIDSGVLSGYLHNAYTARVAGTSSTGSAQRGSHRAAPGVGPHVIKLAPGQLSAEEIVSQVGDGFLVYDIAGLHSGVNPVSGDLSVGADGVRIRGGELAEGIREVTIGSTLQKMLGDVVAIGSDLTYFPWESTGVTLAIADVTMSGQ
jgi:PmbA protein